MRLDYAFLADKATLTHDQKLVVLGGDIDAATVVDLPALLQITLVARLLLDAGEPPAGHTFGLDCTAAGEDRKQITQSRPLHIKQASDIGDPPAARLILDLTFVASTAGRYAFHLILDGQEMKTMPLRVHLVKAEG
jgi:hypothetical protein